MSKRGQARSNARGTAKAAGGAHLTREARMGTLARLISHLHDYGFQVSGVDTLRERHISHYFEARKAEGKSTRTLQNEAAHIRQAMRAEGRHQAADSPSISNAALGISGGSRIGTKTAATDAQYQLAVDEALRIDHGLAAIIMLERTLGLRSAEGVRAGPSLPTWEKQLSAGQRVTVIYGTKGGRPRDSLPAGRTEALEAVRFARKVASTRRGRLLPQPTLLKAMTWYRNAMNRRITPAAGIQAHALRYAYTHDRKASYLDAGLSSREALSATSMDLGHGDGRGRYVASVYGRTTLPAKNS